MTDMIDTLINGRWTLKLPRHRAERAEWWTGWEKERLASMHEKLFALTYRATHDLPYPRSTYAAETLAQLDKERRPVIIDVGAEEGDFPALWSQWGCDVALMEPNPKVWPNIKAIFEANELRMPLAMWVGFASDLDDSSSIDYDHTFATAESGWPRCTNGPVIGDHGFCHLAEQADSIPSLRIDSLAGFSVFGDRQIDAITIDVEGSELRVLEGARRVLREHRPLVWASCHTDYEWNDTRYGGLRPDDVRRFMADLDYVDTHLATDHEQHWFFQPSETL